MDALYQAILRKPDDDSLRLAYADFLCEKEAGYIPCTETYCGYMAKKGYVSHTSREGKVREFKCRICEGSGEVRDTEAADRAELIRCQIALRDWCSEPLSFDRHQELRDRLGVKRGSVGQHCREIISKYPKWSVLECPDCVEGAPFCLTCHGIRNLLAPRVASVAEDEHITWAGGFPQKFRCRIFDVLNINPHSVGESKTTCTMWAYRVVENYPITHFLVDDLVFREVADHRWVADATAWRYYFPDLSKSFYRTKKEAQWSVGKEIADFVRKIVFPEPKRD